MKLVQDIVQKYRYLSLGSSFSVPIGGIIAYTGSLNALPLNYHLCDGTDGTPDLRDRFIVGAGSSYAVGATGGVTTHTHTATAADTTATGTVGATTLTTALRRRLWLTTVPASTSKPTIDKGGVSPLFLLPYVSTCALRPIRR